MMHLPEQDLQDLRHWIWQMRVHDSELLQIDVLPPFLARLQLRDLLCLFIPHVLQVLQDPQEAQEEGIAISLHLSVLQFIVSFRVGQEAPPFCEF